jgi:hypothetical protein
MIRHLPEVRVVEYLPDTGLQFVQTGGWWVRIGTGADIEHKVRVLGAMEEQLARDGIVPTLVDVRYPENPFYRVAGDGSEASEGN